ncbi:hypothetical protein GQ53DRAFT_676483 [Thozetella sp. PMI_491]|nr:hypothetical protein GQ53DRAFT_676483 [Thozetella sp. PMI_491]
MANPLTSSSVLRGMAQALPTHDKADTTSDLSSSFEAVALFTHSCFSNLGFRLLGFNEDQKIESECQNLAPRLPPQWNASTSSLGFVYAHSQSSMHFVIRIDRLGGKAEIRGLATGDERINRFEITARDYISSAALPVRITMVEDAEDRSDLEEKLKKVFISEERITDLATLLKVNIIQKLLPSLQKEGYQEDPDDRAARQDADEAGRSGARQPPPQLPDPLPEPARPYPLNDPLAAPPRRPVPAGDFPPPDFEDEFELNRPPRGPLPPYGALGGFPGRSPFNIGHDDLNPPGLGPHDPLRGSFIGGGLPRPAGGGGMHPTFDDPLFQGPYGGGGPDLQAPPGARWDPIGPGGAPRFGSGRGRGNNQGGFSGGFGGSGFGSSSGHGFGGDII